MQYGTLLIYSRSIIYNLWCLRYISFAIFLVSAAELKANKTRIIQIQPEAGKQGVTTLPMELGKARSVAPKVISSDLCFLPKVIGPCKMSRPSFHFDATKGDCLPFLYGGCKVKQNYTSDILIFSNCIIYCDGLFFSINREMKTVSKPWKPVSRLAALSQVPERESSASNPKLAIKVWLHCPSLLGLKIALAGSSMSNRSLAEKVLLRCLSLCPEAEMSSQKAALEQGRQFVSNPK